MSSTLDNIAIGLSSIYHSTGEPQSQAQIAEEDRYLGNQWNKAARRHGEDVFLAQCHHK